MFVGEIDIFMKLDYIDDGVFSYLIYLVKEYINDIDV